MNNSIDILNELKELSPLIAGMEKVNVFTVPAGYFESLGNTVLLSLKEETGEVLQSISNNSTMQVPQGYFESLADNILNKIKAGENATTEKEELSPLLNKIPHTNVFAVPDGYFENLADSILNKATAPENAITELKELSPMLYSIQNKNVFTVPQGYFESLTANILDKVKPQAAKVVRMSSRRITTILKYAVAAVFTGVMALGVFKFTNNGSGGNGKNSDDPIVAVGRQIAKENKFDEELSKVSDADIIKYLQANGSDVDVAVVANTVDENELPTQEDYLTDDKALDKYLDNIDLKDLKN
jgi:uncharacterized protein YihD (DUF1040 family)